MNNEKIRGEIKRMENEVTRKKYTEEGIKREGVKRNGREDGRGKESEYVEKNHLNSIV
jgi:hypothetical protein